MIYCRCIKYSFGDDGRCYYKIESTTGEIKVVSEEQLANAVKKGLITMVDYRVSATGGMIERTYTDKLANFNNIKFQGKSQIQFTDEYYKAKLLGMAPILSDTGFIIKLPDSSNTVAITPDVIGIGYIVDNEFKDKKVILYGDAHYLHGGINNSCWHREFENAEVVIFNDKSAYKFLDNIASRKVILNYEITDVSVIKEIYDMFMNKLKNHNGSIETDIAYNKDYISFNDALDVIEKLICSKRKLKYISKEVYRDIVLLKMVKMLLETYGAGCISRVYNYDKKYSKLYNEIHSCAKEIITNINNKYAFFDKSKYLDEIKKHESYVLRLVDDVLKNM